MSSEVFLFAQCKNIYLTNSVDSTVFFVAGPTRLELAASGVTGQRYNQLNYGPAYMKNIWWAEQGSNL